MPTATKTRRRTRKPETPSDLLSRLGACLEAQEWVASQPGKSLPEIWAACERGDWMLWLAAKLNVDRKLIVTAACRCARLVLHHVPGSETRPREAIEAAEAWVRGEATMFQVARAAYSAASAVYSASSAAADVCHAAGAAYSAANAVYSASSAANAADDAASGRERTKIRKRCVVIVREAIPFAALGLR